MLVFIGMKNGMIKNETFKSNKDVIDALDKFIKLSLLIIAGIFSYIKFIKGRLFKERLNIEIDNSIIPINEEENLFIGYLKLINSGILPVRNLKIEYSVFDLLTKKKIKSVNYSQEALKNGNILIIDSNEETQIQLFEVLKKNIDFYKIEFSIKSKSNIWKRNFVVVNKQGVKNIY